MKKSFEFFIKTEKNRTILEMLIESAVITGGFDKRRDL
jgi:hypothetical protein